MSEYLGLTVEELLRRANPLGDPNLLTVGDGPSAIPEADLEERIARWDDYVTSRLPQRYRKLLTAVEGEVVVAYATEGQRSFTVGLKPVVTGTLRLYKNWRETGVNYKFRSVADAMGDDALTSFNLTTGAGVLTEAEALSLGDTLFADYEHTATAALLYLKGAALNLILAELYTDFPSLGRGRSDDLQDMRTQGYGDLDRLRRGDSGLQAFDRLKLVDEFSTRNDGTAEIDMPGGYL